jgi:hypothetical protein
VQRHLAQTRALVRFEVMPQNVGEFSCCNMVRLWVYKWGELVLCDRRIMKNGFVELGEFSDRHFHFLRCS